jgi:hypothetical protein
MVINMSEEDLPALLKVGSVDLRGTSRTSEESPVEKIPK